MTEEDGFRIEAAEQFGFEFTNDDATEFKCTEAQLIAFAKACERKGLCEAINEMERVASYSTDQEKGGLGVVIYKLSGLITEIDAVNDPILEAERQRCLSETPTQVSDSECCGVDCADCPFPETAREPCHYCGPGKLTGLPGNACENCMNTGFANPTAEDRP